MRLGRGFSRASARYTLGKSLFCPRLLSDCWGPSQTLAVLRPSPLCPGGARVPGAQASRPLLTRARPGCSLSACRLDWIIPHPPRKDGSRLVGSGGRAIEVKRQMDCLVFLSVTDFYLEGIARRCDSAILFLSHTNTSEILETDVHRKTWNLIPTRHVCVLLNYELKY